MTAHPLLDAAEEAADTRQFEALSKLAAIAEGLLTNRHLPKGTRLAIQHHLGEVRAARARLAQIEAQRHRLEAA
jgi:hypothetical protein